MWAFQAIQMFIYNKKYIGPQACATSWYKSRLTNLSKLYTIQSGGLYRTPSCPSLRRRWWPTPTFPRWWRWCTCRTLFPRRQASTRHGGEHNCSSHNGPPWWW